MATSRLTLYKTKIIPSKNVWLDEINEYLDTCPRLAINNFQYQKIEADISIKIALEQEYQHDLGYNYVKLQEDDYYYYYFITNVKQLAPKTLELILSIDSIHTYRYLINNHFSDKTKIIRTHKDRYYKYAATTSSTKFNKLVDRTDEGINGLPMNRTSDTLIAASTTYQPNYRWNLVYMSDEESGMAIYAYPSDYLKVSNSIPTTSHIETLLPMTSYHPSSETWFFDGYWYFLSPYLRSQSYNLTINGTARNNAHVAFYRKGSTVYYRIYTYDSTNKVWNSSTNVSTVNTNLFRIADPVWIAKFKVEGNYGDESYVLSSAITSGVVDTAPLIDFDWKSDGEYLRPISKVDRTDSRIIKIIEFPYGPCNMVASGGVYSYDINKFEFSKGFEALKLIDMDLSLTSTVAATSNVGSINTTLPAYNSRFSLLRNDDYESKLLHSSFFKYKYVYDSFSYQVPLELMQVTSASSSPKITVYQYMNKSAQSAVAFKFTPTYLSTTYQEDFGEWLVANRNNEQMVLNNEYLNYLKTGYNYDVKNKDTQTTFNWIGTGLQIAGAVASFVAGSLAPGAQVSYAAGISLAVSATASIANNINSTISAENNIAQKLDELRNQSANIATSDSLDLFHEYSGNQLRLMQYKPSARILKPIADLFYYCGYADGTQGIPDYNSRRCFNYLQCEPIFDNEDDPIWIKFLDDVKARFNAGVTVMHKFNNGNVVDYDWEQKYENFETWICPR